MPAGMGSQGSAGQGSSSKVSRGGGNRYSKSKKKSRLGSQSKKSLTEMMEDEKNVLLAEKHGELQDVWNKHDMLVCSLSSVWFSLSHYRRVSDI